MFGIITKARYMPVVLNAGISSSNMTTISNLSDSTVTYSTISSSVVNNTDVSSSSSIKHDSTPTKYIQLQTVRPQHLSTNVPLAVPPTTAMLSQRTTNNVITQATNVQRSVQTGLPPGVVLTRSANGQYVLVNGALASTTLPQASSSNQTASTVVTRTLTTTASTTSVLSATTVGKPVSVVSTAISVKTEAKSTATTTSPISLSQDDMVNVTKCRNFLTTLIKLASSGGQLPETVQNVKALVQNLIDDKITPDEFTKRLQIELKSSPQPYLVPFLEKSLPLLRLTMMQQTPGGQVPVAVAQAALRVSTLSTEIKAPSSPRPKLPTKPVKTTVKPIKGSNIPEIRLPRVTSMEPVLKHPSLQTPPPEQPQIVFHQQSHQSAISGVRPVATMRPPIGMIPGRGGQRWNAGATGGGSSFKDDDDINDVASMAGVNLSEESARILATNSELVGTVTRSCPDVPILNTAALQRRMSEIASRNPYIQHIHADAVKLLSCAAEVRIKDLLTKLSMVVCHRMVNFKEVEHYKSVDDVKTQLKFLQELDQIEKKKHDEAERDILMRAIKSRSKNDNPEHLRLKERAKEMQQQELEKLQIRNADETARNAIGPRKKKARIDSPLTSGGFIENHVGGPSRNPVRSRVRRVNLRDLMFVLEHEKDARKTTSLYKSYLK